MQWCTHECASMGAHMCTHISIHAHKTDPIMCSGMALLLYTPLSFAIQGSPVHWFISGTCNSSNDGFASSDICPLVCCVELREGRDNTSCCIGSIGGVCESRSADILQN